MKEFVYCYQCKHSVYQALNKDRLYERFAGDGICLHCSKRGKFFSKNAEVGDCEHAERVSLDPIVRRINRERGI